MYNLELADRLMDELAAQRVQKQENPVARDRLTSASQGQALNEDMGEEESVESSDKAETGREGEQGDTGAQSPEGGPRDNDGAQASADGEQREMSADEAQKMVDLVQQRAKAAQDLRQQWRQARMREGGVEKQW